MLPLNLHFMVGTVSIGGSASETFDTLSRGPRVDSCSEAVVDQPNQISDSGRRRPIQQRREERLREYDRS